MGRESSISNDRRRTRCRPNKPILAVPKTCQRPTLLKASDFGRFTWTMLWVRFFPNRTGAQSALRIAILVFAILVFAANSTAWPASVVTPADSKVLIAEAHSAVESGEYDRAEKILDQVLSSQPQSLAARFELGYLLTRQ